MTIKSKTIDNLGLDASVRYAKDKELFEPSLIRESSLVSQKTEVSVLKPYAPSEFNQLFASGKTSVWASFEAPPGLQQFRTLFTYQLIPSLGSEEKQEADLDKLSAIEDALKKKKEKRQNLFDSEDEKEEKERKTLLLFIQCLQKLDKTLTFINSRRNQYQRG